jgi:hypothetical protein
VFVWVVETAPGADNEVLLLKLDFGTSTEADNAVSKNNTDYEIGTYTVTLSEAKGLSRWAERCFAALSMTVLSPIRIPGSIC